MLKLLMTRDMVPCAFRITGMFVHFEQERFELVVTCQLWCLEFFLRAIYTFKTLNCTVSYGLWGDFWHLGGGAWPPPPLNPPMPEYVPVFYTVSSI